MVHVGNAQVNLKGRVMHEGEPLPFVNIVLKETKKGTASDESGNFILEDIPIGNHTLIASSIGFETHVELLTLEQIEVPFLEIHMTGLAQSLDETVVTGTLKAVKRMESPVPVEVYSPTFLKRNPTPNIFEALQNVNGVRPQINCNVCNTGDIHINGLEGPYTLVLIDGMPIVSGLGTVYGLSGIPNSLIDQIEIVKGPASSLYGSEAVGGLINIITKHAPAAPRFFADGYATDWGEYNMDVGVKWGIGQKTDMLLGVNYFNYSNPIDNNGDNFTDLTLQDRISIFQKWNFKREQGRLFSLAGRFFYEDRWGGEMQWNPNFRGGDQVYGESIYTRRWEVLGKYQLPVQEKMMLAFSFNNHHQNSVYGDIPYLADQQIGFGQFTWDKPAGRHDLLFGAAIRYNFYNDNTPATVDADRRWIPGVFVQDEFALTDAQSVLGGLRYDHDSRHGAIVTPRAAYKWKLSDNEILRLNFGTGFRVVNLFTEDHAALTGSREVVITEALRPERSVNVNINFLKKIYGKNGTFIGLDASAFYTRFSNAILPDYDTDPNKIIYDNLDGKAVSKGISANMDITFPNGLKFLMGATWQDVTTTENGITERQILTESITGTWNASYTLRNLDLTVDYTGNLYGPMRLPLLGDRDPRNEYSPTWSIQNIQFTYKGLKNLEVYAGIKNLLDWTPNRGNPFIIARAHDPFDKGVVYNDTNTTQEVTDPLNPNQGVVVQPGGVVPTAENPYALTFDPAYVYGPNQGIRSFFGLRYTMR
ncbi:MAG: TonB-dependent receptor [Flavobacteriaceae bacterium]